MKKIFSERKYGIVRAVLFMLMITVLLTLHRQWLVSDEVNFATGENRWNLDGDYERNTVCQIRRIGRGNPPVFKGVRAYEEGYYIRKF